MTKHCFVIMPFSATEKHSENYWDNFFERFIKPSIESLGYSCRRSKAGPSNIIKDVIHELLNADIVIAVLTDYNANVWYELGIRHALKVGTIMIIEEGQKLPFDINQYGVIIYHDSILGASEFLNDLKIFIEKIENKKSVDNPVQEFISKENSNVEYQRRIDDLETMYKSKLDKIVQLLQDLQNGNDRKEKTRSPISRKVLWVDDFPSNNEAIIDLYRQQDVNFDLAINTAQALDYLSKDDYNLIISDMGRGTEYDAGLRMIREINRKLRISTPIIIFASMRAIENYGLDAKNEGAVLVTTQTRELIHKMNEVLEL